MLVVAGRQILGPVDVDTFYLHHVRQGGFHLSLLWQGKEWLHVVLVHCAEVVLKHFEKFGFTHLLQRFVVLLCIGIEKGSVGEKKHGLLQIMIVKHLSFKPHALEEVEARLNFLDVAKLVEPIFLEAVLIHGFAVSLRVRCAKSPPDALF